MSDSTSQLSSRTAKSGNFTSLSRAIKRSDIHLEVPFLQSRKSFDSFFLSNFRHFSQRFRRIESWYRFHLHGTARWQFELWFDFCNAKFHWFLRSLQNRKLFSCVCIAWYKHERGCENTRQSCKLSTSSRVCITASNSPNPSRGYIRLCNHGKRFLLLKHYVKRQINWS